MKQGALVSYSGRACKIRRVLSLDSVVIQYIDGGETDRVSPTELRPVAEAKSEKPRAADAVTEATTEATTVRSTAHNINEISDADWEKAKHRFSIIEPLLNLPSRSRANVVKVAKRVKKTAGTLYRWISSYEETGHISGLIASPRGRKKGDKFLSPEVEAVIDEETESFLDDQAITASELIERINTKCDDLKLQRPHPNTIRNRAANIPLKRRLSTRGNKEGAEHRFDPTPGTFPDGNYPLECVQIDHVRLDIKVVDAETRRPIEARPWLTLVIDSYSRMIVGFYLSLWSPSAFAAGVALYMGMMPKRELLAKLDLPGRWPVFGKFRKVLADNAKEFKGSVLQRACEEHHIDLQLRPVKTPRYGAHIERMIGNVNRMLHKRRGTTHRSPKISPDYDSSGEAIYTLASLECEIVDWIVNSYHVKLHSALKTTPLRRWEHGLLGDAKTPGVGLPPIPMNPEKMRLDFLPFELRAIHPYGVEIGRMYYHEVLNPWIGSPDKENQSKKQKFIFHYDPRTIRLIWFWDPEAKKHFEIPIKDTTWPDISWSEFDEARKAMVAEGKEAVDEASIKGYVLRSQAREQEQTEKTQIARKGKRKSADSATAKKNPENAAVGSAHYAATPGTQPGAKSVADDRLEDIFSRPAEAFEDIEI